MTRSLAAARLYIVNKWTLVWIPLLVIAAMVVLTITIQLVMVAAGGPQETMFNGAFQAVFWCLFGVAISASTQVFPFAFAMSLTRRDFWLGTLMAALAVAIGYGILCGLLALVESVTGGYGIGARTFELMGFASGPLWESAWLYGAVILLFFTLGFAGSMVWKRAGGLGLVITGLAMVIGMSALAAWIGFTNRWLAVGHWIIGQTPVTVGLYAVAVSVVLAGASYLLIRHAEP